MVTNTMSVRMDILKEERPAYLLKVLKNGSRPYIRTKGPPLSEAVPLCGQVVLYRTFLEDLEKVYLSGLQVIGA